MQNANLVRPVRRLLRTHDNSMLTFDRATIDSAGAFLVGELERLDQRLNMPLAAFTWSRDLPLRTDVSMGDETASFTNSSFASAPTAAGSNKSWISKDATSITGISLDIGKTAQALPLLGYQLGWTLPELASAARAGRPVDAQKYEGMLLKYQMDVDEQAYVGDNTFGVKGLLNHASVTNIANVAGVTWPALIVANAVTAPDLILADINELLTSVYQASAFAFPPSKLLLPPLKYTLLASTKVSSAGNESILEYVKRNNASAALGVPLDIRPVKWCIGVTNGNALGPGTSNKDRMCAYTPQEQYVRLPLVPMARTPLEYRGIHQLTTYYGRLGQVETPYAETIGYRDGL
jgi:hypothetical protein